MCGICGFIHFDGLRSASENILRAMTDTLAHRGPDDAGYYLGRGAALGHRRLSIIDLKTGHQPIFNEDKTLVIVYNGEVYNFPELKEALVKKGHRFSTHSDTEVILHAYEEYGEDCVNRFNGMFAFAIWDEKVRKLFMARDRFGKKPLYYAVFDNQFIFGSELKALLKHPSVKREISPEALSKYLAYEYVPSPLSILKNVKKLEAGSKISVANGSVGNTAYYWDLPSGRTHCTDVVEAESRLLVLLKESVKKRLISDVPLGVFLSGGIDSSAVVSLMAELTDPSRIKTFSVGFGEKSYDESSDARLVARHFGTDHHEEILGPEKMLEVFPKVLDQLDEPFADSSIIPTYLVSQFTRKHVKVALGGDGGDELFMGYPSFLAHKINSRLGMLPPVFAKGFLDILSGSNTSSKLGRFARGLDFPEDVRHQAWIGSLTPKEQKALFLSKSGVSHDPMSVYDITRDHYHRSGHTDPLDKAMYIYIKTYMTDDILAKVDRASMANSLEVRAPFLDTEFAEFAAGLPSSFKMRGLSTKWILKKALSKRLPARTLSKRKQGFAVPVAKWLRGDLRGLLMDAFNDAKIRREGIFDPLAIKNLVKDFTEGRKDLRKEIWVLFMFEMWYDRWMG